MNSDHPLAKQRVVYAQNAINFFCAVWESIWVRGQNRGFN